MQHVRAFAFCVSMAIALSVADLSSADCDYNGNCSVRPLDLPTYGQYKQQFSEGSRVQMPNYAPAPDPRPTQLERQKFNQMMNDYNRNQATRSRQLDNLGLNRRPTYNGR